MGKRVRQRKEKQGIFAIVEITMAMTIVALLRRIGR